MPRYNGVTLPELMIALSIISVISMLAMPSFQHMAERQQARSAVHSLFQHFRFARSASITYNRIVTVCPSTDKSTCHKSTDWSGKYILLFIDNDGDGERHPDDILLRILDFSEDRGSLRWRSFGNRSYIQWYPTGMMHFQNGNLTYCPGTGNPQHARQLITNAVGRVYFAIDRNGDGIVQGANGRAVSCP